MPSLRDVQANLRDFVFSEVPADSGPTPERLQIHRNTTLITLREALKAVYPIVHRLVGDDFFAQATRAFIRAHPPRQRCLIDYGGEWADFIAGYGPALSLPYLADVARLEWAWHTAFHAADGVGISVAALRGLDPDAAASVRLFVHPSAQLIHSRYPIDRIWRVNQDDAPQGQPIHLDDGAAHVLIVRPRLAVEVWSVDAAAFAFMSALQQGLPMGEACAAGAYMEGSFEPGPMLAALFNAGAIVGFVADMPPASRLEKEGSL